MRSAHRPVKLESALVEGLEQASAGGMQSGLHRCPLEMANLEMSRLTRLAEKGLVVEEERSRKASQLVRKVSWCRRAQGKLPNISPLFFSEHSREPSKEIL